MYVLRDRSSSAIPIQPKLVRFVLPVQFSKFRTQLDTNFLFTKINKTEASKFNKLYSYSVIKRYYSTKELYLWVRIQNCTTINRCIKYRKFRDCKQFFVYWHFCPFYTMKYNCTRCFLTEESHGKWKHSNSCRCFPSSSTEERPTCATGRLLEGREIIPALSSTPLVVTVSGKEHLKWRLIPSTPERNHAHAQFAGKHSLTSLT